MAQLENITNPYALYFLLAAHLYRKPWARLKHLHFWAALLKKAKNCLYVALLTKLFIYLTLFENWYVTRINTKITCKTGALFEWRVTTANIGVKQTYILGSDGNDSWTKLPQAILSYILQESYHEFQKCM